MFFQIDASLRYIFFSLCVAASVLGVIFFVPLWPGEGLGLLTLPFFLSDLHREIPRCVHLKSPGSPLRGGKHADVLFLDSPPPPVPSFRACLLWRPRAMRLKFPNTTFRLWDTPGRKLFVPPCQCPALRGDRLRAPRSGA